MLIFPVICSLILSLLSSAIDKQDCFVWGINGHPLTQKDYASPTWDDQIKLLKYLKIDSYRIDAQLTDEGAVINELKFNTFINKLIVNKISPFVVLSVGGIKTGNKQDIFNNSFNQGKNFGNSAGKNIPVIEVGNEFDNKILKGPYDGTKESHYDLAKAHALMMQLSGFINGLKSVNPQIKISLSVGWVHYYYLQLLQDYNINYDIIGYHWYSNMGNIASVKGYGNVLETVADRFKKPIWITEFNFRNGSLDNKHEAQKKYIQNSGLEIVKNPYVSGFFIYELLDEPGFEVKNPKESFYGLASAANGVVSKKSAYYTYKYIIENHTIKNSCNNILWKVQ
ncbi:MAG: glycosyl hydrolase 53 domain protein [Sphingobacteriales bacterium]|nr:glycosyl hydrolase 53 domain protein [Sphingobacteriales bacterium]